MRLGARPVGEAVRRSPAGTASPLGSQTARPQTGCAQVRGCSSGRPSARIDLIAGVQDVGAVAEATALGRL
eukprot:11009377-Alexandrium_andersonii.AAC.1